MSPVGTNANCQLHRAMSASEGKAENICSDRVFLSLTQKRRLITAPPVRAGDDHHFPRNAICLADDCSPPVWPPPPLIEAPRRHQGRAVWIDPVVFRAITISRNNIIIPRSWPYHGHPDKNPPWFMNDLCLPRPGFSTRRPEVTQHQGRSESARDGHYLHASASLPESAKGLKARQANSLSTGLNDRFWHKREVPRAPVDVRVRGPTGLIADMAFR
jgi:hypothetical protein